MTEPHQRQRPQWLTAEGELTEAVVDVQRSRHPRLKWLLSILIKIVLVVLAIPLLVLVILLLSDHVDSAIVSAIITILIVAAIYAVEHLPFIKLFFDRVTFPFSDEFEPDISQKGKSKKRDVLTDPYALMVVETTQGKQVALDDLFLLYPNHRAFLTQRSRYIRKYTFNGEMRFVFSIILPLVCGGTLVLAFLLWAMMDSLVYHMIQMERIGIVTTASITNCRQNGIDIDLTFRYSVPDFQDRTVWQIGQFPTNQSTCGERPLNSSVVVRYLPINPTKVRLDPYERGSWNVFLILEVPWIGMLFFTVGLIPRTIDSERRFRYLKRNGVVLFGHIMGHGMESNKKGKPVVALQYCFLTPDERDLTPIQRIPAHLLRSRDLPAAGTPVAVLYADDGCYKLL